MYRLPKTELSIRIPLMEEVIQVLADQTAVVPIGQVDLINLLTTAVLQLPQDPIQRVAEVSNPPLREVAVGHPFLEEP